MSDSESPEELIRRLEEHPPEFLGIPVRFDSRVPRDAVGIVTTNPSGSKHLWIRNLFTEKGNTMPNIDQTAINLDWKPKHHDPTARRTDPGTSYAAAASVKGADNIRERVHALLREHPEGLTHEQIIQFYGYHADVHGWPRAADQSIRSRTKELERDGMVRRNKRPADRTKAGRLTHRWYAVTDPGEQASRRVSQDQENAPTMVSTPGPVSRIVVTNKLADDILAARRAGAFHSDEISQFLFDKGWRLTGNEVTER